MTDGPAVVQALQQLDAATRRLERARTLRVIAELISELRLVPATGAYAGPGWYSEYQLAGRAVLNDLLGRLKAEWETNP